jgi:hypothetical protein
MNSIKRMKLTGAAILVSRGMKALRAAPAAYPYRSARKVMATQAKVIGVHPIEADEPVHLIELLVEGNADAFDIGEVTQEVAEQPKSNWQAPYDERVLEESDGKIRYAFFFHELDHLKPLLTPLGSLPLPEPTKAPAHLQEIVYESP